MLPSGWIWTEEWMHSDSEKPKLVHFRRTLNTDKELSSFVINISADSRYRLYVNGNPVCVGPCKGDDAVWYYETVDVAEYMTSGENVIAATVLRYPTDGAYNHSVWRTKTPGLYLKGRLEFPDGTGEDITCDKQWKSRINRGTDIVSEMPYGGFLNINETAAGISELQGWTLPGYNDESWAGVKEYSGFSLPKSVSPGGLCPRPIPLMYETARKFAGVMAVRKSAHAAAEWEGMLRGGNAVTVAANTTEIVELNAGELTTGYLRLALEGGDGAEIKILCSESYAFPRENPTIFEHNPIKSDRTDWENGTLVGYTDVYTAGGFGTPESPEVYEPFWFRTFRFVRLEIAAGDKPLTVTGVDYRETGYPLEPVTTAAASDPDFAGIWDISLRSLRRCMHETYEDCPFYEQLQYAMDTRSQILFTYATAGDDRMARRTIDDFSRSQRPDGMINCCYPSYGPNIIPGFSIYYILMIHDHMMYFGDRELVRRYLPTIDGILEFFHRALDERGIVGSVGGIHIQKKYWSFIDWVDEWQAGVPKTGESGCITMESLLYIYGLMHAAELAEYAGRGGVAGEYRERAENVRKAIRKCCAGKDGLIKDSPDLEEYSQHCQAFAALTNTVTGEDAVKLMEAALDQESLAKCSVSFAFYLFRALEQTGLYHRTKPLWNSWREMLKMHLTTCVENGASGRSDCHAWGSLLLYELPAVILGVRPAEPGYKSVKVQPNLGYLDSAEGSVITPHGMVKVSVRNSDGAAISEISAPEGVKIVR
jgi:hypothetical protein